MKLIPYLCLYGSFLCSHHIKTIEKFEPKQLKELSDAVDSGVVISYHTINIPGLKYCYNPAYIPDTNGTDGTLIVRVDGDERYLSEDRKLRKSTLYAVRINDQLKTISNPVPLQTFNEFSEDPRAVRLGEYIALICNEHHNIEKYSRSMVVHIYDNKYQYVRTYKPQYQQGKVEKNWTPLFSEKMDFIYSFDPFTVITFDPEFEYPPTITIKQEFSTLSNWEKMWGTPRGGTPFIKVGDKMLGFFHSSIAMKPNKKRWFLFGAIELSFTSPQNPERISKMPIYSKRFYQSTMSPTAPRRKFVVYPSGLTLLENQNILRIFCGLNDSKVLAIDINREALETTLEPI